MAKSSARLVHFVHASSGGRLAAAIVLALVLVGQSGCSFIFDFAECDSDADCRQFEQPDEGEFFVCSSAHKCVLEPTRQCRADSDCPDGQRCQTAVGTCGGA